jgi:hypothetical protein
VSTSTYLKHLQLRQEPPRARNQPESLHPQGPIRPTHKSARAPQPHQPQLPRLQGQHQPAQQPFNPPHQLHLRQGSLQHNPSLASPTRTEPISTTPPISPTPLPQIPATNSQPPSSTRSAMAGQTPAAIPCSSSRALLTRIRGRRCTTFQEGSERSGMKSS